MQKYVLRNSSISKILDILVDVMYEINVDNCEVSVFYNHKITMTYRRCGCTFSKMKYLWDGQARKFAAFVQQWFFYKIDRPSFRHKFYHYDTK